MNEALKKLNEYVADLEGDLKRAKGKRDGWRDRANAAESLVDATARDAVARITAECGRLKEDNDYLHEMVRKLVKGGGDGRR